jgi:plastocyanin
LGTQGRWTGSASSCRICETADATQSVFWVISVKFMLLPVLLLVSAGAAYAADPAHTIVQKDRAFHPTEVTINRGESLTFTNNDTFIHQIYVIGLFDSEEKAPGENLTENFTQAGTFEVQCHIHPKMKLVVHVK